MADAHSSGGSTVQRADVHHETSDVNIRGVLAFGLGLVAAAGVIHFVVWLLFAFFLNREAVSGERQFPLAAEQQNRLPTEPRLQTNPRQDMADFRAREDAILNGYAWVDKDAGIVRIPVAEAMKLVVERGLPTRTENQSQR